ncbi:hypothetical protein N0V90_012472 [Kalmusia sp. IMI 367209]|nr:hypothetical protein N0V90_012472 [Kalmusia sp. IMI 367209]
MKTEELFASNPNITLIDGGIIGGVPYDKGDSEGKPNWHCPALIVSGSDPLPDAELSKVLNMHHLDKPIGAATGLKMCYAVTTKGFYALAIESFTTAHELGVMYELRSYLERYSPSTLKLAESGLISMPPKAYRWVHEMFEIADTMAESGGFDRTLFQGVAEVYRVVAEDTELGKEQPGARVRGKTVEDVVTVLSEGMRAKKLKTD